MKQKMIPALLASAVLFSGCLEQNTGVADTMKTTDAAEVKKEDAVAKVNGTYISKAALANLESEISQRSRGQSFPQDKLVEELIQRELLAQDAMAKGLDQTDEFRSQMQSVKHALLSQAALQQYADQHPITDEDLKAEYAAKTGGETTEYKARHILLKEEAEAKAVIDELKKGADFAELAKSKSTGPSAPQGGDLGWFTEDRMVPAFSQAVVALENGKYTTEPVKTNFGWHVILREDSRKQSPPPFESVKEQIRPMLQRQQFQKMVSELRNKASIEILLPEATQPAETAPAGEPE